MRYLLIKSNAPEKVLTTLAEQKYTSSSDVTDFFVIITLSEYLIFVDTVDKTYMLLTHALQAEKLVDDPVNNLNIITNTEDAITMLKNEKPKTRAENSFDSNIQPGYLVNFECMGEKYKGIIMANKDIMYYNCTTNKVEGTIGNYTENSPYIITSIERPTEESDLYEVVWSATPHKVKKSISEIENELGLTPGTLEIS